MGRQNDNNSQRRESRDVAIVHPPRLPYPVQAQDEGITAGQWKALTDAVFPAAKTVDGVMLAIAYAKARKLDIFKRVVHVVPMWNSSLGQEVDTVWPGIGELRTTASRTGAWAGTDECVFGPSKVEGFSQSREREARGNKSASVQRAQCEPFTWPEWAQVTVYKMVQGQRVAFVGPKVRFIETFSGEKGLRVPNSRWQQAPFQMLEKCAEAAALRRAFPEEMGDEWTAEEMEGKEIVDGGDLTANAGEPVEEKKPAKPTRKADPKKPWSDEIDAELAHIQHRLDSTHNSDPLPEARDRELERHPDWPAAAKTELARRFDDRIAALDHDKPAEDPRTSQDPPAEEYTDADFERYITRYEATLFNLIGNAPDLNSFQSGEKTAIGQLSQVYRERAERAFELAMHMTKTGESKDRWGKALFALHTKHSGAGETAAGDDDQSQRSEEEQ
jgi:phage recombination protein Bet